MGLFVIIIIFTCRFGRSAPRTVENFRAMCTGEKGVGRSGQPLHYKGTAFNRIIPHFMIQGGNVTAGNRMGGEPMHGHRLPRENFRMKHSGPGLLTTAIAGRRYSGSQFAITTVPFYIVTLY